MNGILLVDKPSGWTSHDVVAKVRSILRQQLTANSSQPTAPSPKVKVGHTGTLDPAATGLLLLLVGNYTKRAAEYSKLDKAYEAEITLGATSSTGDSEGEITPKSAKKPATGEMKAVLRQFEGQIMQAPHQYSAVKVGGQRSYKAARAGKTVEIEPRKVTVYELRLMNYDYPKLQIKTRVSSGTYIRSLAEDIGEKLGTGAYLSALRRTQVGDFSVVRALELENINYSKLLGGLQ